MIKIKRIVKKCSCFLFSLLFCFFVMMPAGRVYAEKSDTSAGDKANCVQTSIIGNGEVCDKGDGESVLSILELVMDIMTIGVGILGVIGISVVGIQYLTAGGNEENTRKAKRRMFEIVIGLVAYALVFSVLRWLLPVFNN